ncbi:MAG: hypothetical protein HBSAPP02_26030 [Phycisphaerae bacterium]|nr:MAG: tetratricopeptide repeat protein [Planctomycetia bacterium]GJQ27571.1 MAG: hypothetical protein HBSAPP02_26030 [Phycisphaerae bacterium]
MSPHGPTLATRIAPWQAGLLIALAGAGVYANSLNGPFVFDDQYSITENVYIRSLWPLREAVSAPYQSTVSGRPVVAYTLAINYALGGLDVRGYHLFNVLIHLASGLLLFGVVRRTLLAERFRERFERSATALAVVTALLWVVHPLQTESVTYVIQRVECMVSLFYLATLYCVVRAAASPRPLPWSAGAVICSALGMGCKEVMVTAPFVIFWYDVVLLSGGIRQTLARRGLTHLGIAATWLILFALIAGGPRSNTVGFGLQGLSPVDYARTQFGVLLKYLQLSIFPLHLCIDYAWPIARTWTDWVPQMCAVAMLLAGTIALLRRHPPIGLIAASFFIILSPTSSFVPIVDPAFEHRMYLALAPLCALAVLGTHEALSKWAATRSAAARLAPSFAIGLVGIALLALGGRTIARNRDYATAERLWRSTLEIEPANPRAHLALGAVLLRQERHDEAIALYRGALEKDPRFVAGHYGMAQVLNALKRYDEALTHAEQAVKLDPKYPEANTVKGVLLTKLGRLDEAAAAFRRALELDNSHSEAHFYLACIYDEQRNIDAAIHHYRETLRIRPEHADALRQLADLLVKVNEPAEAIPLYRRNLFYAGESLRVLNGLANALSFTDRIEASIPYYERALALAPDEASVHFNYANTLARLGRWKDAIPHYEATLRIRPELVPAQQALARAQAALNAAASMPASAPADQAP